MLNNKSGFTPWNAASRHPNVSLGYSTGFTLIELIIAIMIFSFMMISLVTIYATSNRHLFQSYRENIIKTNMTIVIKKIQNELSKATRIDAPAPGNSGNELKFATNVDSITDCRPLVDGNPVEWHYFCLNSTNKKLYHYTGTVSGAVSCPGSAVSSWTPAYSGSCDGADDVILENAVTDQDTMGEDSVFSRKSDPCETEPDQVRIVLRVDWQPTQDMKMAAVSRPVQVTFDTNIKPKITGQTP